MIITLETRDGIPGAMRRRLDDLAQRFPVGLQVRHVAGWTGQVAGDFPGNVHGGLTGGVHAHCLTGTRPSDAAVCVEWTVDGRPAVAWYRPSVLAPVGKGAPASPKPAPKPKTVAPRQRQRTRRAA